MPETKADKKGICITPILIGGIIGLLFGVGLPANSPHPIDERFAAKSQIDSFSLAVNSFYLDTKQYPAKLEDLITNPDLQDWRGPYLCNIDNIDKISLDPWGNPYRYQLAEKYDFIITSAGRDGKFDTADDLNNIRQKE